MYGGLVFVQEKINSLLVIIIFVFGVQELCVSDNFYQCLIEMVFYVVLCYEIFCCECCVKVVSSVDLSKVKCVVGVGCGLVVQDDLKMVYELVVVLNVEVGCLCLIVEGENWMECECYIGVFGVLLKFDFYLMLGIFGQI